MHEPLTPGLFYTFNSTNSLWTVKWFKFIPCPSKQSKRPNGNGECVADVGITNSPYIFFPFENLFPIMCFSLSNFSLSNYFILNNVFNNFIMFIWRIKYLMRHDFCYYSLSYHSTQCPIALDYLISILKIKLCVHLYSVCFSHSFGNPSTLFYFGHIANNDK
jgi:hypothetical protein